MGSEAVRRSGAEALGSGADDGGLAAGMEEAVGAVTPRFLSPRASCATRVCGDEAAVLLAPIIGRVKRREAVVERRKIKIVVKRETEYHSS